MLRIAVVALSVPLATAAFAAAWTLDKGRTQTFVVSSFTYGDNGFDKDGKLITVPEYRKFALTGTMEYGLRPWLTALASAELKDETTQITISPDETTTGTRALGSVEGGARVRLHQGTYRGISTVASLQATAFSGDMDTTGIGNDGDGAGVEVRGLVGASRSLRGIPVFADLEVGVRQRFSGQEDSEAKIEATVGAHVTPRLMLLAQSFSTLSLDGTRSYHKVSASVVRQVTERLSVEVGAFHTIAGTDALQETGGRLGFWWSF